VPRIAVVLNTSAGTGKAREVSEQLTGLFTGTGRELAIGLVPQGGDVRQAAQAAVARGCDLLVAAGGDGTVSSVAGAVVGGKIPLGILPLGTLNHFAKDLGIPLDLEGAARVLLVGNEARVDVAEVNGRVFLNNAGLGVYPHIVRMRGRLQAGGLGRWLALLWATLAVVRRRPFFAVRVETPTEKLLRRTPLVMVGNNEYRMTGLQAGSRESVSQGELAVYLMNAERRRGLLLLGWRVLLRGVDRVEELELVRAKEAVIETRRGSVRATLDGELTRLDSPLHFRSRPGSLRVLVP
jgi:diacylglycerol kinase family enzyme